MSEAVTAPLAAVPRDGSAPAQPPSLARASGSMAIANLVSRLTGFIRTVMLAGIVGFGTVNDSYSVANNFPNIVYELLLGGVLASVVIPVLVRAQHEDADGGEEYAQRLLTVSLVVLVAGTIVAVLCSPLLTRLYFSGAGNDSPALTTAFTYLILPEILFYGIFGLLSGILNARHSFKAPSWASVANNLVVFVTLGVYAVLPGAISVDPVRMGEPKLLVLGIGTTLGIVVQALVLLPSMARVGFHFRWRWGWDRRLSQFGKLAFWLVLYVVVSQVGYVELTKVATAASSGSMSIYSTSWTLVQVPYGILGVSLLTAIMPRMSKAAATGDIPGVVANLSNGIRLTGVMMIPIIGLMTVLGPQIGEALFSIGKSGSNATEFGLTLTTSSFGILCYAVCMLQLRVFYAMNDARTPTIINMIMVLVRLGLFYACAHLLSGNHVVYGLTFANGFAFLVGAIVGEIWLRNRIGRLETKRVLLTLVKATVASIWGLAAALLIAKGIGQVFTGHVELRAWSTLVLGSVAGLGISFGLMALLRVPELSPALAKVSGLIKRR